MSTSVQHSGPQHDEPHRGSSILLLQEEENFWKVYIDFVKEAGFHPQVHCYGDVVLLIMPTYAIKLERRRTVCREFPDTVFDMMLSVFDGHRHLRGMYPFLGLGGCFTVVAEFRKASAFFR